MAIDLVERSYLPINDIELLERAQSIAPKSYNRYSGFFVGAAVRSVSGAVFAGAFYENRSFGLTICAEPAAILAANSAGERDLTTIAIVGGDNYEKPDAAEAPCMPCGRCRQIFQEVESITHRALIVYSANLALSRIRLATSDELLPHAFG